VCVCGCGLCVSGVCVCGVWCVCGGVCVRVCVWCVCVCVRLCGVTNGDQIEIR